MCWSVSLFEFCQLATVQTVKISIKVQLIRVVILKIATLHLRIVSNRNCIIETSTNLLTDIHILLLLNIWGSLHILHVVSLKD